MHKWNVIIPLFYGTSAPTEVPFPFQEREKQTKRVHPTLHRYSFRNNNYIYANKNYSSRVYILYLESGIPKLVKVKAHKRFINGKVVKVRSHYRSVWGRQVDAGILYR